MVLALKITFRIFVFDLPPFAASFIIRDMRFRIFFSSLFLTASLLAATQAWAGIIDEVRGSLSQHNSLPRRSRN